MKMEPVPAPKAGRGRIKRVSIERSANGGHTMTVHRESKGMEYREPDSMSYGPGQHEQMMSDQRRMLGMNRKRSMPKRGMVEEMGEAMSR